MRCWLASPGSQQRRHGQASAWRSACDAARMLLMPHAGEALCPAIRQLQGNTLKMEAGWDQKQNFKTMSSGLLCQQRLLRQHALKVSNG